jgi:hypothetical protein
LKQGDFRNETAIKILAVLEKNGCKMPQLSTSRFLVKQVAIFIV